MSMDPAPDAQQTFVCVDKDGREYKVPASELTWRPSVVALVVHEGKVLLTKQHGKLEPPGGGMEFGEQPEEVAVRETFEETGIRVKNPKLAACTSNLFKMPGLGECIQSIVLYYRCDFEGGELSLDGLDPFEQTWSEQPEWVSIEKLDNITAGASFDWRAVLRASLK